jgi:hypothetical protein
MWLYFFQFWFFKSGGKEVPAGVRVWACRPVHEWTYYWGRKADLGMELKIVFSPFTFSVYQSVFQLLPVNRSVKLEKRSSPVLMPLCALPWLVGRCNCKSESLMSMRWGKLCSINLAAVTNEQRCVGLCATIHYNSSKPLQHFPGFLFYFYRFTAYDRYRPSWPAFGNVFRTEVV